MPPPPFLDPLIACKFAPLQINAQPLVLVGGVFPLLLFKLSWLFLGGTESPTKCQNAPNVLFSNSSIFVSYLPGSWRSLGKFSSTENRSTQNWTCRLFPGSGMFVPIFIPAPKEICTTQVFFCIFGSFHILEFCWFFAVLYFFLNKKIIPGLARIQSPAFTPCQGLHSNAILG